MNKVIATIGLSRGRVAFYDPKSNIMLDLSKPTAHVFDYMNTEGLKNAIGGTIYLVGGSLITETEVKVEPIPEKKKVKTREVKADKVEKPREEPKKAEVEDKPVDEKDPVQEEKKPKKAKKTTK